MILDNFKKEKRRVENIRYFLKGLLLGFIICILVRICIQKGISTIIDLAIITVLFISNIYFRTSYKLERKYMMHALKMDAELKTGESSFYATKLEKLSHTILNDTIIDMSGYYKIIILVIIITPIYVFYTQYRFFSHMIPLWYCISLIVITALLFASIVNNIGRFKRMSTTMKEIIIEEGWNKE